MSTPSLAKLPHELLLLRQKTLQVKLKLAQTRVRDLETSTRQVSAEISKRLQAKIKLKGKP